jgi:hypothetical protein
VIHPVSFGCTNAFKRLRTQRSDSSSQLSLRALYSNPTQLDRPRHGSVVGEIQVQTQAGSPGICGRQIGSGNFFGGGRISVFPCQYHSTNTPYAFIRLSPTLHNPYQLTASLNNTPQTSTYQTSQRVSFHGTVL